MRNNAKKCEKIALSVCAYSQTRLYDGQDKSVPERVAEAMEMVEIAKKSGAELAIFPEICLLTDFDNSFDFAEPLDGPIFEKVSQVAKENEIFISFNHPTLLGEKKHNTTVLFNKEGKVESVYHKTYPTMWEMEKGCWPGDGPVVVDTEIGRIGFATCYDLNFAELRDGYRKLNPDVILFQSYFRGGLLCRLWAYEARSYLVSSVIDPGSVIVSPIGKVLKQIDCISSVLTYTIGLDYGVFHYDYNNLLLDDLCRKYGDKIEIDHSEAEGVFLLTAKEDVSIAKVAEEMGLEEVEDYFARAREIQNLSHNGSFPKEGPKAW